MDYTSPHFRLVQQMGLRGYLPGWNASLDEPIDAETLSAWKRLSKQELKEAKPGVTTRLAVLQNIR